MYRLICGEGVASIYSFLLEVKPLFVSGLHFCDTAVAICRWKSLKNIGIYANLTSINEVEPQYIG